ncbi:C-C motif chemokine 4 [Tauraco erythrolophus]|uniref:C-C motif chemokine 4 n=1 Tax=Tauraco erythrolophus TaxID=121530 RepID=A0A093D062_TAUER|nr:PREDICTED: C-C motif chemokine 4-like [Tauraco erythrolophus]KFV20123.1 C-C motif chemokine 4 [Tauraco erythrolophus]
MRISAAVFALLLIAASFSQTFSGPAGPDHPICCVSYARHRLPQKLIAHYYSSSTACTLPAIVFVTKKGRQVCANPSDPWVQTYLQNLTQN